MCVCVCACVHAHAGIDKQSAVIGRAPDRTVREASE
jgi:hypothetical protein